MGGHLLTFNCRGCGKKVLFGGCTADFGQDRCNTCWREYLGVAKEKVGGSSEVEHLSETQGAAGSNPAPPATQEEDD